MPQSHAGWGCNGLAIRNRRSRWKSTRCGTSTARSSITRSARIRVRQGEWSKTWLCRGRVIALIARDDQIVPPQGSTRIHANDHVILVLRPGIEPLVNQVFGRDSDVRGTIPSMLEFPLRASTTVGELQECYTIRIDEPPESTLAEVLNRRLEGEKSGAGSQSVWPVVVSGSASRGRRPH
ncbi:MAG: hypothetical protein M5U29_04620 [Anaerolineae bacterium]|nr:hypothetical protein [Anaerolineae bacterium]